MAVNTPMVSYQGGAYSVPHRLLRRDGAGARRGPTPGSPQLVDDHFLRRSPAGAIKREPKPGNGC